MTKNQRQLLITDWLREHRVGSQEELVARLSLAGITATQATVSRDLLELGAVKLKRGGSIRYVMPDQVEPGRAAEKLDRLLAEWVEAIIPAGNLLVLGNAVAQSLQIAAMERFAPRYDARALTFLQMTVAFAGFTVVAVAAGGP